MLNSDNLPIRLTPNQRRLSQPQNVKATESFCIPDANGQALIYVYYENEPGRRMVAGLLTRDEARRIAAKVAARTSH